MTKPVLLLSGFEPFAGSPINPSAEVVKQLAMLDLDEVTLHTCILPVAAQTAPQQLCRQLEALQPDIYLGLGEARGRSALNIEQVGVNELNFRIPDNSGLTLTDQPIAPDGPPSYPSTFPAPAIRDAIRQRGIPAVLSDSAGRYLCNQILYTGLHWAATQNPTTLVGFIHLPSLPAQMAASDEPKPTMALSLQVEGLWAAVSAMVPRAVVA